MGFNIIKGCKNFGTYNCPDCVVEHWGLKYNSVPEARLRREKAGQVELCQFRYRSWCFYWENKAEEIIDLTGDLALSTWLNKIGAKHHWVLDDRSLQNDEHIYKRLLTILVQKNTIKSYERIDLVTEYDKIENKLGFFMKDKVKKSSQELLKV